MKRNHLRTIGVNLAVLIGLIMALDFISISVFEARNLLKGSGKGTDDMLERMPRMPAFEGVPWIEEHVRDVKGETSSYVSFIGWRRNPMRSGTVNIDSSGVRCSYRHPSTGPTAVKAVFLGGSTMWGTGSPDSLTIPSHFNRLGGGRYDAVNYGESSYNAYQGYQFLLRRVLEGHRPDIVVSYDGVNNSPTICPRPFAHARETQIARLLRGADRPDKDELTFKGHYLKPTLELMRKVAVATGFAKRDTLPGETAGNERPPMSDAEAAKYLLDSWMATFGLAESVGARFLCVLQPNVRVGKPDLRHMLEEEKGSFAYTFYDDVLRLMETEPYRVLKPHFLDLRDAFDGVPKLYFDFCHVHPKGNSVIAQRILDRLASSEPSSGSGDTTSRGR